MNPANLPHPAPAREEPFIASLFQQLRDILVCSVIFMVPAHRFGGSAAAGSFFGVGCQLLGLVLLVVSCYSSAKFVSRCFPAVRWQSLVVFGFYGFWIAGMINLTT